MKKKVSIAWRIMLLLGAGIFTVFFGSTESIYGEKQSEPELYAKSAVLMDADSGRILYEKNGYDPMPMASTTKIMTCIIALEEGDPEQICEVSPYAASQPKVHIGVSAGEKFLLKDLLYSLMLESHNDAAVIIAEAVAGSVEAFAELMNQKAWELGCQDTYFITPNGLDKADERGIHSTTAADLAAIMAYCIQNEEFLEITRTASYTFTDVDGKHTVACSNHNAFLQMMEGALSGKTGFTGNAGYCYVGALERDGEKYVVALLACGWPDNRSYKWKDTRALMNYGLDNYSYRDVWEEREFGPIPVDDGIPDSGDLGEQAMVSLTWEQPPDELQVLMAEDETVQAVWELPERLSAPVKKGDVVGRVTYTIEDIVIGDFAVVAADGVEKLDWLWCLKQSIRLILPAV